MEQVTCECCGKDFRPSQYTFVRFPTGVDGTVCLECIYAPEPKVVCLVGSTRFFDRFAKANLEETLKGNIVLSIGCDTHHVDAQYTEEQKQALDRLHKRKINMANEVLVLNVDNYIGPSTRSEIEWAVKQGIPVRYLEQEPANAGK